MKTLLVKPSEEGMKLATFLHKQYPDVPSLRWIKRAIESKFCQINRKLEWFPTHRLSAGDKVTFFLDEALKKKKKSPPPILFEDEHLLVLDKTPGITCSQEELDELFPDRVTLLLAHRLDKETSGVWVIAKSERALEHLMEQFASRTVKKSYYALVDGSLDRAKGVIDKPIGIKRLGPGKLVCSSRYDHRKRSAITEWKRLKNSATSSFVELRPLTGRTHQLRVHMSEMGHPILGDLDYGKESTSSLLPRRHLLHAFSLELTHPVSEKTLLFKAPFPEDFVNYLKLAKIPYLDVKTD